MSEKDVTSNELLEILNRVKYYCQNRSCYGCVLRKNKNHTYLGKNYCMLRGLPCYWEIEESKETEMIDEELLEAIKRYCENDVAVVHAQWKIIKSAKNTIKCSNCGHIRELKHFGEIINRPKFCEMCGVKMYESAETK